MTTLSPEECLTRSMQALSIARELAKSEPTGKARTYWIAKMRTSLRKAKDYARSIVPNRYGYVRRHGASEKQIIEARGIIREVDEIW